MGVEIATRPDWGGERLLALTGTLAPALPLLGVTAEGTAYPTSICEVCRRVGRSPVRPRSRSSTVRDDDRPPEGDRGGAIIVVRLFSSMWD